MAAVDVRVPGVCCTADDTCGSSRTIIEAEVSFKWAGNRQNIAYDSRL